MIEADLRAKSQAALASGDRDAARAAMRKNMAEAMARLEPALTPAQKQKLAALRSTFAQGRDQAGYSAGVVYVLRGDEPTPVPVRVGASDGSFTEIRGPLKAGDQVIVGGGPKAKAQIRTPLGGGAPRP